VNEQWHVATLAHHHGRVRYMASSSTIVPRPDPSTTT
jgi:hypothetical protein